MVIYGLSSSESPDNIRYVGKAKSPKDRLRRHISKYNLKEDTYKNRWIKLELLKGNKIEIKVIEEVKNDNWEDLEIYWISEYKKLGYKLTNATIGGDGLPLTYEIINKRNKTRIENNLKSKSEIIKKFKIKKVDIWSGERICPKCNEIVFYKSKNLYNLIHLIQKNVEKECCSKKEKNEKFKEKGKKEKNEKFKEKDKEKIEEIFIGERTCPNCGKIIKYSLSSFSKLTALLKKSENRKCLSCSGKEKTPFRGHKWTTRGMKYKTNNSKLIKEKYGKKILQYDKNDKLVNEFVSIRDASNETKIDRKSISQCIRGIRQSAGGYIFKQKEEIT